jgi:hypothetical protein
MNIASKTISSPPLATQRETKIIPVAMFKDIAIGHKRPT